MIASDFPLKNLGTLSEQAAPPLVSQAQHRSPLYTLHCLAEQQCSIATLQILKIHCLVGPGRKRFSPFRME